MGRRPTSREGRAGREVFGVGMGVHVAVLNPINPSRPFFPLAAIVERKERRGGAREVRVRVCMVGGGKWGTLCVHVHGGGVAVAAIPCSSRVCGLVSRALLVRQLFPNLCVCAWFVWALSVLFITLTAKAPPALRGRASFLARPENMWTMGRLRTRSAGATHHSVFGARARTGDRLWGRWRGWTGKRAEEETGGGEGEGWVVRCG